MHIPGMLGMPRRIYTYEADRGWALLNQIVSSGAVFQAVATLIFVWNLVASYFKGEKAGPDPWDAWTLEWSTSFAPTQLQLRRNSYRRKPAAAVGSQTSGRTR